MVMLGKLITHEFAFGIQFPGHRFPPARNPWNLDHIPGGSSSGSGAALAAGMTVGALGSDTGGSIRGPAAFCGIAGLKPTYGRVSRAGVVTLSWTLDHTGPMARTVEDCAFMLQALAGHDPADPGLQPASRWRTTWPPSRAASRASGSACCATTSSSRWSRRRWPPSSARWATLGRLGATVRDVTIPSIHATPSFMVIMLAEAFAYHERDLRARPELYGDVLREKLMAGGLFTGGRVRAGPAPARPDPRGHRARPADGGRAGHAHRARARRPRSRSCSIPDFPFAKSNMGPFNITGLPTLALPTAASPPTGLPLSLQISGRPFDEATVLRAGHAYRAGDGLASPPAAGARMTTVGASGAALDDLKAHVGRRESATDVVTAAPANLLRLTFGRDEPELGPGDALPPGWHVALLPAALSARRAAAGRQPARHRRDPADAAAPPHVRGRALPLPPAAAHRRDGAPRDRAGRHLGQDGRHRHARLRHRGPAHLRGAEGLAIEEERRTVFREEVKAGERNQAPRRETAPDDVPVAAADRAGPGAAVPLLRADLQQPPHPLRPALGDGARGLPGLVVHGPLTSTLLIDFARDHNPGRVVHGLRDPGPRPALRHRALRAARPPHRGRPRRELWAVTPEGTVAMSARAELA